jgi:hypothetical protein
MQVMERGVAHLENNVFTVCRHESCASCRNVTFGVVAALRHRSMSSTIYLLLVMII